MEISACQVIRGSALVDHAECQLRSHIRGGTIE